MGTNDRAYMREYMRRYYRGKKDHRPAPDGSLVKTYSQGEVARKLGLTGRTIRRYHEQGWLPETLFPQGPRRYTKHQIHLIQLVVSHIARYQRELDQGIAGITKTRLKNHIRRTWNKGVSSANDHEKGISHHEADRGSHGQLDAR